MNIEILIDKLTHSIEDDKTGQSYETLVLPCSKNELIEVDKSGDWDFSWMNEFISTDREIYKLVIKDKPAIIQGLINLSEWDDHIFVELVKNAPTNKGKLKKYIGAGGNMFAFACKVAFERGA